MSDIINGTTYDVARERMQERMREAEKARLVREITRRKADAQNEEFRPTSALETVLWAVGRWGRHALPSAR